MTEENFFLIALILIAAGMLVLFVYDDRKKTCRRHHVGAENNEPLAVAYERNETILLYKCEECASYWSEKIDGSFVPEVFGFQGSAQEEPK